MALTREALHGNRRWPALWRHAEPRRKYNVVIVGGGGHGLATAYYLAKNYDVGSIAVIERSWIGGGNTGRNTTNIRSDYLYPESAALYDLALRLYETLGRELNYNLMVSQRGWITLAHSAHDLEILQHKVNALACNGIKARLVGTRELARLVPLLDLTERPRYPVRGGLLQQRGGTARHDAVAWGLARAADRLGVDIVENCEVTGFRRTGARVTGLETTRGEIEADKVALVAAGRSSVLAQLAGLRLPITSMNLQAMVTEPLAPLLDKVVISPATGVYVNQSDKGELVMGGMLNLYPSYRTAGNASVIERVVAGALEMFPDLAQARLLRHWSGIVDVTPDSSPIIGKTPIDNLYINCGWGTGGFKAIPAGGLVLAETIARDEPHPVARPFALSRFARGALIDEGAAAGIAH